MNVFVTGASGWIGSATVDELLAAGHHVTGLARSDTSAAAVRAKGAEVLRGDLDDLESIRAGAAAADAVIHLANKHDFSDPAASNAAERAATQTIGDALAGSNRPFLIASGLAALANGRPATEEDPSPFVGADSARGGSENLALDFVERGVRAVPIRFAPTVHGAGDHGFVAIITAAARSNGLSGYAGDGTNRWAAVHRGDAARLVRLALERAADSDDLTGVPVHAIAEEGVSTRSIAEAIGEAYGLPVGPVPPEEMSARYGWIGQFFAADLAATSTATRERLGWAPTGPTLLEDLAAGAYGRAATVAG